MMCQSDEHNVNNVLYILFVTVMCSVWEFRVRIGETNDIFLLFKEDIVIKMINKFYLEIDITC